MDPRPQWTDGNAGMPDMRITSGQSLHDAYYAAERIRTISKECVQIDIRDASEQNIVTVREVPSPSPGGNPVPTIVDIFPRPAQRTDRPKRRTLSTREN